LIATRGRLPSETIAQTQFNAIELFSLPSVSIKWPDPPHVIQRPAQAAQVRWIFPEPKIPHSSTIPRFLL
jgi:hypothetical protein